MWHAPQHIWNILHWSPVKQQHRLTATYSNVAVSLMLGFQIAQNHSCNSKKPTIMSDATSVYCNFGCAISTLQYPQAPENSDLGNLVTVAWKELKAAGKQDHIKIRSKEK